MIFIFEFTFIFPIFVPNFNVFKVYWRLIWVGKIVQITTLLELDTKLD